MQLKFKENFKAEILAVKGSNIMHKIKFNFTDTNQKFIWD